MEDHNVKRVEPQVFLLARPAMNEEGLAAYLRAVGASGWATDAPSAGEKLIEVAGRSCYRSFEPGLNPNVTKIREGSKTYLENILKVKHGSVIEHANWTFAFFNVSRVFTHEVVRHRAGTAISQESLRFVRLTEIGMWLPPEIRENPKALAIFEEVVETSEKAQQRLAEVLDIEGRPFHEKKVLTSPRPRRRRRLASQTDRSAAGRAGRPRDDHHLDRQRPDAPVGDRSENRAGSRGGDPHRLREGGRDHDTGSPQSVR